MNNCIFEVKKSLGLAFGLVLLLTFALPANFVAAQEKGKITISYAKFGEGRHHGRVEKFAQELANKKGVTTHLTSKGLKSKNPSGKPRPFLHITYQVDGVTGTLILKYGQKVDLRSEILKHAVKNGKAYQKIEISYALFGDGRNKARCEEQVAAVASQVDIVTPITTHGLSLRNPSGRPRKLLVFRYKVDGKTGSMTLKYGEKVDLRKTIIAHARVDGIAKADPKFEPKMTKPTPRPSTPRPTKPKPTTPRPSTPKPTTPRPSTPKPTTPRPTTPRPTTPRPTTPKPNSLTQSSKEMKKESTTKTILDVGEIKLKLPGKTEKFAWGANGRILILEIPEKNALYILDVMQEKFLDSIPLQKGSFFAASREHLVIANPNNAQLQKWSLKTLQREKTAVMDRDHPPMHLSMGSDGDGPLVLINDQGMQLWDIESMKDLEIPGLPKPSPEIREFVLTVSADGKTICCAGYDRSYNFKVIKLGDEGATIFEGKAKHNQRRYSHPVPTRNGDLLLDAFGGVFTGNAKDLSVPSLNKISVLPTTDSDFFLTLKNNRYKTNAILYSAASFEPIIELKELEYTCGSPYGLHKEQLSFQYLRELNRIVMVNGDQKNVTIRKFDLKKELAASGRDYLHVISRPKSEVRDGDDFSYQIKSLTNVNSVKYSLEVAPSGMTITDDGLVNWKVKKRANKDRVTVVVSAKGPKGELANYSFDLDFDAARMASILLSTAEEPTEETFSDLNYQEHSVDLPEEFDRMVSARGGKILIFHSRKAKSLFVFDVMKRQIIREIDVSDDVLLAASQDKLIVASHSGLTLSRYDLDSFRREKQETMPRGWKPKSIAMGCSGDGPLAITYDAHVEVWDLDRMRQLELVDQIPVFRNYTVAASPEGSVFCLTGGGHPVVMEIIGAQARFDQPLQPANMSDSIVIPTGSGKLFGNRDSIFDELLRKVEKKSFEYTHWSATRDSRFVMSFHPLGRTRKTFADVRSANSLEPIFRIPDLPIPIHNVRSLLGYTNGEPIAQYFHEENLIVYLAADRKSVVYRDFNLAQNVKDFGEDFVKIVSTPEPKAFVNSDFSYQLEVVSNSDRVSYRLKNQPRGMRISSTGLITWPISERPIGGILNIEVEARSGSSIDTQICNVAIRRNERIDLSKGGSKAEAAFGFARVDDQKLELPTRALVAPGLEGTTLVLAGQRLAFLDPTGKRVLRTVLLSKHYKKIIERRDQLICISSFSNKITMIDKKTLRIKEELDLGFRSVYDIVAHPSLPICYVSGSRVGDLPSNKFVVLNERNGKAQQSGEWIGKYMAIDLVGQRMYTAFSETYQKGNRLLLNPERFHIIPEYGSIDWMLSYKLDSDGTPEIETLIDKVGANASGIRLTADGKRVSFLSYTGISKNIGLWNTRDFKEVPTILPVDNGGNCRLLEVHPRLPLVVTPMNNGIVLFDSNSGRADQKRLMSEVQNLKEINVISATFSGDGRSLLVAGKAGQVDYLYRVGIRLNAAEARLANSKIKIPKYSPSRSTENASSGLNSVFKNMQIPLVDLDGLSGGLGTKMSNAEIAKSTRQSIVVVHTPDSTGTGFVVGDKGYVLTCAHCVSDPKKIQVTYDRTSGKPITNDATLLAIDEERDIALLRISEKRKFQHLQVAVGSAVSTGESVSVIGHPGVGRVSLSYTMTQGIISSESRKIGKLEYIQTSAVINPGCSGGPMFNDRGQVIGMVVAKARDIEGTGFSIPANVLADFLLTHTENDPKTLSVTRDWFDSNGKGPLNAKLISSDRKGATVKRIKDGREFELPLSRLSDADQMFLKIFNRHNQLRKD